MDGTAENPLGVDVEVMKLVFVSVGDVEEVVVESSAARVGAAAELLNWIFDEGLSWEQRVAVR